MEFVNTAFTFITGCRQGVIDWVPTMHQAPFYKGKTQEQIKPTHQTKQAINESTHKYSVMSGNEEILLALSPGWQCGWGCYFREKASPLKSHLNKGLNGSFGYLGKKCPSRWSAPGPAGVPGKAWRPCAARGIASNRKWGLTGNHMSKGSWWPRSERATEPSFIFWRFKQF